MSISRRGFLKLMGFAAASPMMFVGSSKAEVKQLAKAEVKKDFGKEYSRVRFYEKKYHWDSEHIDMVLNGQVIVVKRGVPVILPNPYLEICDNAFRFNYDGSREIKRQMYPYVILGPATKKQYDKQYDDQTRCL